MVRRVEYPAGTVYVPNMAGVVENLSEWAGELGLDVQDVRSTPAIDMLGLNSVRLVLWISMVARCRRVGPDGASSSSSSPPRSSTPKPWAPAAYENSTTF